MLGGEPSTDTSNTTSVGLILLAQNGAILASLTCRGGVGRELPAATAFFSPANMAKDGSVGLEAKAGGRRGGPGVAPGVIAADMAGGRVDGVAVGADRRTLVDGVVVVVVVPVVMPGASFLACGLRGSRPGMGVAGGGMAGLAATTLVVAAAAGGGAAAAAAVTDMH